MHAPLVNTGASVITTRNMQLGLRFAVAAVFYGFLTWRQEGRNAFRDGTLPSGLLLGALFSLEFILVALALTRTSAAHTIVFLYTAPIFTALGLRVLPHERLNGAQWGGIALAIGGIATAFFESSDRSWTSLIGGDALAILAGAAWGLSNVALRMGRVSGAAIAKTIFYQVGMGGVLLIGFAYLNATTCSLDAVQHCRGPTRPSVCAHQLSMFGFGCWDLTSGSDCCSALFGGGAWLPRLFCMWQRSRRSRRSAALEPIHRHYIRQAYGNGYWRVIRG